jgi:sugar (pentulose or hexulose) kinase
VLNIPFVPLTKQGDAPMGMALLAGKAAGLFDDLQETCDRWIKREETVSPDPSMHKFYRQRRLRYEALMKALNTWGEEFQED